MKKGFITAIVLALSMVISTAQAALIKNAGDKFFTDTETNLDWLEITRTTTLGRSFNQVTADLGSNPRFTGFRFASLDELSELAESFIDDDAHRLFNNRGLLIFNKYIFGFTKGNVINGSTLVTIINVKSGPLINLQQVGPYTVDEPLARFGSFLVRNSTEVSAVPIPAAAFMFAPALLGFLGLRRRTLERARAV